MHLTVNVITGFFLAHLGSFLGTPHLKCYLPKNQAYITYCGTLHLLVRVQVLRGLCLWCDEEAIVLRVPRYLS